MELMSAKDPGAWDCGPLQPANKSNRTAAEQRNDAFFMSALWVGGVKQVVLKNGAHVKSSGLDRESSDESPGRKIKHFTSNDPRVLTDINDVSGLKREILLLTLENGRCIHDESFRFVK
jgi:hypothetical protein